MEVTILTTNRRTTCVAQTCRVPFRRLSTPTEEYCETSMAQYSSVRITFGGGNVTCAIACHNLHTFMCTHTNTHSQSFLHATQSHMVGSSRPLGSTPMARLPVGYLLPPSAGSSSGGRKSFHISCWYWSQGCTFEFNFV